MVNYPQNPEDVANQVEPLDNTESKFSSAIASLDHIVGYDGGTISLEDLCNEIEAMDKSLAGFLRNRFRGQDEVKVLRTDRHDFYIDFCGADGINIGLNIHFY
jgi:hypothetical protein